MGLFRNEAERKKLKKIFIQFFFFELLLDVFQCVFLPQIDI